ncbi:hypothetical protein [Methylobacterium sp. SD21]|uniref:hypothetical protein n=1 Tax=Methylobacterium litchii TaxID=3138810 RepID=UPI00313D3F01
MPDRAWNPILVPSAEQWGLKNATRTGGQSFSGVEQLSDSPAARWGASLTIPCGTQGKVLAMRAAIALGRSQVWIIGPVETARAPWFVDPLTGGRISYAMGAADAATDPAFETNPDTASTLDFRAAGPVAMNATAMTIQRNRGGLLQPGMMFSIGNRLHLLTDLLTPDPGADAGYAQAGQIGVGIRPWTRADYAAGAPVEFGRPVCRMRLASDDTGALQLQLSRTGSVSLDLIEAP